MWPFTCSGHLAGSPGPLARRSPLQGLESQRESIPGQLGSVYAGGWQLARPCAQCSSSSVTRSRHVYLIEPASCLAGWRGATLPGIASWSRLHQAAANDRRLSPGLAGAGLACGSLVRLASPEGASRAFLHSIYGCAVPEFSTCRFFNISTQCRLPGEPSVTPASGNLPQASGGPQGVGILETCNQLVGITS